MGHLFQNGTAGDYCNTIFNGQGVHVLKGSGPYVKNNVDTLSRMLKDSRSHTELVTCAEKMHRLSFTMSSLTRRSSPCGSSPL